MRPLAIDLFCGLGGWTEGLLAEGYDVVGFDIERHRYPARATRASGAIKQPGVGSWDRSRPSYTPNFHAFSVDEGPAIDGCWVEYPAQLVIQDVLTLHGSQFRDAALIVASPPCQAYSYRAMPWKRAKALPPPCNALFDACFRIQREAIEAAGHHIPLVVENVRGAQPWVGRARWNFGSFYLWGDVPALMPITFKAQKFNPDGTAHPPGSWFAIADSKNRGANGAKVPGFRFDGSGRSFQTASVNEGIKAAKDDAGGYGGGFGWDSSPMRRGNSKSPARKAASAMIARIPLPLSRHIAATYR